MEDINSFVPDYRMDDSIPSSSGFCDGKNNDEEGLMEIFFSQGRVVEKSVERSLKKLKTPQSAVTSEAHQQEQPQLFMQEDEMASWLHFPVEDEHHFGGSDLVYPAPPVNRAAVAQIGENRPPIPPRSRAELQSGTNFSFFNRLSAGRGAAARESGVDAANQVGSDGSGVRDAHLNAAEQETFTVDLTTVASSSGGVSSETKVKSDQKRKSREDEGEDHDEEGVETKKRARGSSSTKRSRAAEVHNQSERRRRDRINEKMKALQELIPRCNKSDKASMLDEAIEYLKHLQLQVQAMSMGCSLVPMVYTGGQPYMIPMDMGFSRPIIPFPQVAGSSMPRPVTAAHLDPRLPIPSYLPPTGSSLDLSRMRPNQSEPLLSPYGVRGLNAMPVPFADSYHRYFSHYNMQAPPYPPPETHTTGEASTSKVESGENQKAKTKKLD